MFHLPNGTEELAAKVGTALSESHAYASDSLLGIA
jgi:hypothetical protein